jgi:23S rRNA (cytidine1920-2'-O)/16S rRNA (cytidine1409-2'-O)-methyltransferase
MTDNARVRADTLLAEKLGVSRAQAKQLIINGLCGAALKPSSLLPKDADIDCPPPKYVGRGGLKLEKALDAFNLSVENEICLDVGASTGGFTQCLLSRGAKKVYAVDVGENQLNEGLKSDSRVVSLEKTNAADLTAARFDEAITFACIDVSFISVTKILLRIFDVTAKNANTVFLIKPQFEAGRQNVGKRGVVKNPKTHEAVLKNVADCAGGAGFHVASATFSPIRGKGGNIEYLLLLKKTPVEKNFINNYKDVVSQAFYAL